MLVVIVEVCSERRYLVLVNCLVMGILVGVVVEVVVMVGRVEMLGLLVSEIVLF